MKEALLFAFTTVVTLNVIIYLKDNFLNKQES